MVNAPSMSKARRFFVRAPFLGIALLLAFAWAVKAAPRIVTIDDFEAGLSSAWKAERFKGETRYEVVADGAGKVLRATADKSASGLVRKIEFDPKECRYLIWRWKVDKTVKGSDPTTKSGDDYAARVYVVFPSWIPLSTKSLNYIWATAYPKEGHLPNPYFQGAMMLAVESGDEKVGKWVEERRDIAADFTLLFGGQPPKAGAVAVMTDTDQTGEKAVAYYDDFRLECGSLP